MSAALPSRPDHQPWGSRTRSPRALLTAAREAANPVRFALVLMLGPLGLPIFEATGANLVGLGEEHGHRVLRVCGKGTNAALAPLPPAAARATGRATGKRAADAAHQR